MFATRDRPPCGAAASSRPATLAAPARISSNLRQESQIRPCLLAVASPLSVASLLAVARHPAVSSVFNRLRTLWPTRNLQPTYFQSPTHSLQRERKLTHLFTITSPLFVRSSAQERKSTPLVSCACALFRTPPGGRGGGAKAQSESPRPIRTRVWALLDSPRNRVWLYLEPHEISRRIDPRHHLMRT